MSKRANQRKLKLCILSKIKENKHILLGQINNNVTKEEKTNAWKEIYLDARSIGAVNCDKDYTYMRDIWFNNIKRSTIEKVENAQRTGIPPKFNEVDECIRDIIGQHNHALEGFNVPKWKENSINNVDHQEEVLDVDQQIPEFNPIESCDIPVASQGDTCKSSKASKRRRVSIAEEASSQSDTETVEYLKRMKLKLVIENLRKESYLKTLQMVKLERELSLPASEYTAHFSEHFDSESMRDDIIYEVDQS